MSISNYETVINNNSAEHSIPPNVNGLLNLMSEQELLVEQTQNFVMYEYPQEEDQEEIEGTIWDALRSTGVFMQVTNFTESELQTLVHASNKWVLHYRKRGPK